MAISSSHGMGITSSSGRFSLFPWHTYLYTWSLVPGIRNFLILRFQIAETRRGPPSGSGQVGIARSLVVSLFGGRPYPNQNSISIYGQRLCSVSHPFGYGDRQNVKHWKRAQQAACADRRCRTGGNRSRRNHRLEPVAAKVDAEKRRHQIRERR